MENNDRQEAQPQQPVMEEAQAAPQQAMDSAPATPEVHDDPGIPQQEQGIIEDTPQAAPQEQQQGIAVGEYDPNDVPDPNLPDDWGHDPRFSPEDEYDPGLLIDGDPSSWEFGGSDDPDPAATTGIIVDPVPSDQAEPPDSEAAAPPSPEAVSMPVDKIVDPAEQAEPSNPLPTESEDPTPGGYDGSGIAGGLDLDQNGVFDQIENNPDISDKDYAYDEDAYEDAEHALKDLRHALKHGDEEDRAEALEKLQGYLGGFGKGGAEDENDPHNHGDPEEVANAVDKEPADAPDASGAAVSGAAIGAGAVGEAIDGAAEQAGGAIDDALGIEGSGEVIEDIANGNLDEALDTATDLAGGAIDEALGIEGSGEILDDVLDGDWDKVTDTLPDLVEEGVEEYLGIEGAGEAFEDILQGDWDELGDHIGEAAGSYVGNVLGGPVGAAIGEEIGEFVGDGVGDAVTEEVGDISTHIENGDYDELAGDVLALNAGAVGGLLFGDDGAAVGQEIGEAVGDTVSEVVEDAGEVVEDIGEALEDVGEEIGDFFGF